MARIREALFSEAQPNLDSNLGAHLPDRRFFLFFWCLRCLLIHDSSLSLLNPESCLSFSFLASRFRDSHSLPAVFEHTPPPIQDTTTIANRPKHHAQSRDRIMAPEQSSQTDPQTVSPVQSSVSPSTQPREPSPLVHPAQRASTTDTNSVQSPYGLYPQSYGSHYVPYDQTAPQQLRQMQQQQAPVNMPNGQQPVTYMTVPAPFQQPPESNKRKVTKDILHVIVIIICIIGMGFAFSLLGRSPYRNYSSSSRYYYYDDFDRYIPAMSAGPVVCLSVLCFPSCV